MPLPFLRHQLLKYFFHAQQWKPNTRRKAFHNIWVEGNMISSSCKNSSILCHTAIKIHFGQLPLDQAHKASECFGADWTSEKSFLCLSHPSNSDSKFPEYDFQLKKGKCWCPQGCHPYMFGSCGHPKKEVRLETVFFIIYFLECISFSLSTIFSVY